MTSRRDEVRLRNAQWEVRKAEEYVDERCVVVAQQTLEKCKADLARIEALAADD